MEYTKGEWEVGAKYDEQGWPTYRLKWMDNPNDKVEVEANAHLITAAPALYEALSQLLSRLDFHGSIDVIREEGPVEDARQALALARE